MIMPSPYRPPSPYRLPWQLAVANLPKASDHPGQAMWCTDLHENLPGYIHSDGIAWMPQRTSAIARRSAATALALKPLLHRPVQILTATIPLGGLAITFDTAGAWNGLTWRIIRAGGGTGAVGLLGKVLAAGQVVEVAFDGAAFVQISPISLL